MHKCAEYVIYFYLMKAAVIGHVSIDLIESRGNRHISLGGAPIYSGKILSETGIRVKAITKIGIDDVLKFKGFFEKNSIDFELNTIISNIGTTKFLIKFKNGKKTIKLLERCENIELEKHSMKSFDVIIISPIVGELIKKNIENINKSDAIKLLDPQGYIRKFNKTGICNYKKINITKMPKTDIIKINKDEIKCIVKNNNTKKIIEFIKSKGYKIIILTNEGIDLIIYFNKRIYKMFIPENIETEYTIGLGDIFNSVFVKSYIKEEDPLWSASLGIAVTNICKKKTGIDKINWNKNIEQIAHNIYQKSFRLH